MPSQISVVFYSPRTLTVLITENNWDLKLRDNFTACGWKNPNIDYRSSPTAQGELFPWRWAIVQRAAWVWVVKDAETGSELHMGRQQRFGCWKFEWQEKPALNLEKTHCTWGWRVPGLQHSQGQWGLYRCWCLCSPPRHSQPCLLLDGTRGTSPAHPVTRMGFLRELLFFLWVNSPIQYLCHVQLPGSSWVCLATGRSHSAYGDTLAVSLGWEGPTSGSTSLLTHGGQLILNGEAKV